MPNCGTETCKAEAVFRVYWPGQTTKMCEACNARAHSVAEAMGFVLNSEALPPRKPYAPPEVLESGDFARLTLACSHLPTGMANCHPQSVSS